MRRGVCVALIILTGLVLLVVGILVVLFFQSLVNAVLRKELALAENSQTYDMWRKPPITPLMKIHYFNVTNSKEFLELGHKAKLKEVGPYVYKETWEKVDVKFNDNGTVSFRQVKKYHFDRSLSVGGEDDVIIVPNVPMMTAVFQMQYSSKLIRRAISTFLDIIKLQPFVNRTVAQLTWGYDDPLIRLAKQVLPEEKRFPYDKFGFFIGKNNTPGGVQTAWTGKDNITNFLQTTRYEGMNSYGHWLTDECNAIKGTDGSGFHPMLSNQSVLYVFQSDFCRPFPLVFAKDVEQDGLPAMRFMPPDNIFADVETNPENKCFCTSGPPCTKSGLFNVSVCQFGAPVLLSFPHFYLGDKALLEDMEGLRPEKNKHEFYMDVQPKMGLPLRAKARLQINVAMVKVEDIVQVQGFQNVIFPIVWFEDTVESLGDDILSLVRLAVFAPDVAQSAISYGSFALGSLLLICAFIYMVRRHMRTRSQKIMDSNRFEMDKPSNGHGGPPMKPQQQYVNSALTTDDEKAVVRNNRNGATNGTS